MNKSTQEFLYKALTEICNRIELCGASPELTGAVSLASDLAQGIGNEFNPPSWYALQRVANEIGSMIVPAIVISEDEAVEAGQSTETELDPPLRYFLFTYSGLTQHGTVHGNLLVHYHKFPSSEDVVRAVRDNNRAIGQVVISGWNEFETEEDYNNFIADSRDEESE